MPTHGAFVSNPDVAAGTSEPAGLGTAAAAQWVAQADALRFEAITTVYATSATVAQTPLAQPMLALRNTAALPAQFVFDRGQLGSPRGMLAFVISACEGDRARLEAGAVRDQEAEQRQAHAAGADQQQLAPVDTVQHEQHHGDIEHRDRDIERGQRVDSEDDDRECARHDR